MNGAWTRSSSETFSYGGGDIALFFLPNSAAAPNGLTITVSAPSATYLQSSAAEYSGVAAANPIDQAALASGNGTSVSTGLTTAVPAGELVYSALTTGGNPGSVTPGTTQGVTFKARASTSNGTAYEQDVTAAVAGAQRERLRSPARPTGTPSWPRSPRQAEAAEAAEAHRHLPAGLGLCLRIPSDIADIHALPARTRG